MATQPIILFDGVCNLCNRSVQYVIKHDRDALFRFASLQGETGRQLLKQYGLSANDMNSFVLIQDDKAYTRSTAALKVAQQLSGPIKLLYGFIIVPAFIRNAVYDLIARNRYKWFGKKDACMIPTASLQSRFLN
jgi:predicted DCC family thiol-disulfide oxidoreductase YuxK